MQIFFCTFHFFVLPLQAEITNKYFIEMENRRFEGRRDDRREDRKEPEIVYSKAVKAGKRIYYLDVKKARNEDLYLCITESKKFSVGEDAAPQFEKHKVFLYKEDFAHFVEGLEDVINYIKAEVGPIEDRVERVREAQDDEEAPAEKTQEEPKEEKKGFFARLRG